ncbi:MAG: folate-binding protein [Pseudomonadota bacterium]|nr:folate-binding protein [Pseudomonadota bacterium]
MSIEHLSNRAVIELRDDGILSFLHNVLTCTVENLIKGGLAYGALLSPQGKILHDVFIHHAAESVFLDCAVDQREAFVAKLKLYRLRAKFEIIARDDLHVEVGGAGAVDPRYAALGGRMIADGSATGEAPAYRARRFALGIADSDEIGSSKLFPHEANFDLLNAVDFKKGCYIGQEVVSRMQHRGLARSRILPVTFEYDQPADEIRNGDVLLGEILGRNSKQALALMRLDRVAEHGMPVGITLTTPDWMKL